VERIGPSKLEGAPEWFVKLFPIHTVPGQALVQDNWIQYGTLTLASQEIYAYQSLWEGTLQLLLWFLLGAAVTGGGGTLAMRVITRPLDQVVDQAQAIADRRFLTIAEPRTPELKSLARAMNDMVGRLKTMFNEEAARLEALRQKVNRDAVTGLSSREYFLSHLREALQGDQFGSSGSLVLVRLLDLNELNTRLGHQQTDALLKDIGAELYSSGNGRIGQRAGRIKGAEFAIVCPTFASAAEAARDIHERLMKNVLPKWSDKVPELFQLSAVGYHRDQAMGELLARADETLARAAGMGPNSWAAVDDDKAKAALPAE